MVILSLKLDKLFMLHVPLLITYRHDGSQKALSAKDRRAWMWDRKKTKSGFGGNRMNVMDVRCGGVDGNAAGCGYEERLTMEDYFFACYRGRK
jgi:hypothetical protein